MSDTKMSSVEIITTNISDQLNKLKEELKRELRKEIMQDMKNLLKNGIDPREFK